MGLYILNFHLMRHIHRWAGLRRSEFSRLSPMVVIIILRTFNANPKIIMGIGLERLPIFRIVNRMAKCCTIGIGGRHISSSIIKGPKGLRR